MGAGLGFTRPPRPSGPRPEREELVIQFGLSLKVLCAGLLKILQALEVGWQEEGVTNRKQAIYQCGRGCWKKIMKVIFEPRYTVPPIRAQSSPTEKSSVLSATSEPHDGHRVPWLSGEKRREDELGMKSTLELLGGDHWGTRAPPRPRRKDTALRAPRPGRSRGSAAASRARGPELQWQRQPPAPRPGAGSSPGTGSREAD